MGKKEWDYALGMQTGIALVQAEDTEHQEAEAAWILMVSYAFYSEPASVFFCSPPEIQVMYK